MWIWSNDKESLVNHDTINLLQAEDYGGQAMVVAYETGKADSAIMIGEYDSMEQAVDEVESIRIEMYENGIAVHEMGGKE